MRKYFFLLPLLSFSAFAQASPCNQSKPFTLASGTTTIVTADGQNIHVCKVSFAVDTAVDIKLVSRAASDTNLTGVYSGVKTFSIDFEGQLSTGVGSGLGINASDTTTGGGVVTFYETAN